MSMEGRYLHNNGLFKDTLSVHRDRRKVMGTKLERIAQISKEQPKVVFTSIYHLINEELLLQCHKELDGSKAVGIDKVTKDMYNANLEENIKALVIRLKNKAYKPTPALRVYIPKGNGKMRPLGISIYEDKIVQLALKKNTRGNL